MHVHTFMYIVAKYEITKFTSNRGQCAYYTTKRPPTKTQSLPQWHFYGFALCRQVCRRVIDSLVSSGVYFPHTPPTVAGVFVVPIREWPSLKNRNSCLFGCQVDNGRSSFWRVQCTCQPLNIHVSFYGHPNGRVREGPLPSLTLVS